MRKATVPESKFSSKKSHNHPNRSVISSSSESDSDGDSSSSSSATGEIKIIKTKSPPASETIVKNVEAPLALVGTDQKTANTTNTNEIITNNHAQHVAMLDKLAVDIKGEVKRGLELLNTCVNQLAQSKWILVNVERTLDDFYQECPVCKAGGINNVTSNANEKSESPEKDKSRKESHSRSHSHSKHEKTENFHSHSHNQADEEKTKSHKIIQPMGRSGLNFSSHSSKYKHNSNKKSPNSKGQSKIKFPALTTSSKVFEEDAKFKFEAPSNSENIKVDVPAPAKYKAGPRSKTRPLEKILEKESNSVKRPPLPSITSQLIALTSKMAVPKTKTEVKRTEAHEKELHKLVKKGANVTICLENISIYLNGKKHIKDWSKLHSSAEEEAEPSKPKGVSPSNTEDRDNKAEPSKSKSNGSDSDNDIALSKLKRKNDDVPDKPSKKHKTSSQSKEKHQHYSEKHSSHSVDKHMKSKNVDKDRKSIDSHRSSATSINDRKSEYKTDEVTRAQKRRDSDFGSGIKESKLIRKDSKIDKSVSSDVEMKSTKDEKQNSKKDEDKKTTVNCTPIEVVKAVQSSNDPVIENSKCDTKVPAINKILEPENNPPTSFEVKPVASNLLDKEELFKQLKEHMIMKLKLSYLKAKAGNPKKKKKSGVKKNATPKESDANETLNPMSSIGINNANSNIDQNSAGAEAVLKQSTEVGPISIESKEKSSSAFIQPTPTEIEVTTTEGMKVKKDSINEISKFNNGPTVVQKTAGNEKLTLPTAEEAEITSTVTRQDVEEPEQDEGMEIHDHAIGQLLSIIDVDEK